MSKNLANKTRVLGVGSRRSFAPCSTVGNRPWWFLSPFQAMQYDEKLSFLPLKHWSKQIASQRNRFRSSGRNPHSNKSPKRGFRPPSKHRSHSPTHLNTNFVGLFMSLLEDEVNHLSNLISSRHGVDWRYSGQRTTTRKDNKRVVSSSVLLVTDR